jgi:GntP family gluconate:H+ symporter
MIAGLSAAHGLIPPHPGPMVAIEVLKADAGKTILYSLIFAIPAAILAGPVYAKWISRRMPEVTIPTVAPASAHTARPGFAITVFTVALPVLLMLCSTVADLLLPKGNQLRAIANFIGSPIVALTVSVIVSFFTFGLARGFTSQQILKFTEDSLGPTASALLIVGAGGGFNKILVVSGVGDVISRTATSANLSPLLLGWVVAVLIRIATGSATVAITTAAGILAPIVATQPVNVELLVVVMGAGSLIASHVNDGGFWFVKEYLGLTVAQTFRTWTVIETIIAVVGLLGGLALNQML